MKTILQIVLGLATTAIFATDANAGRWLSRDPIEEGAGFVRRDPRPEPNFALIQNQQNLYVFVFNSPIASWDLLGLKTISFTFAGDALIDVFNLGAIDGQIDTVKTVLAKCDCKGVDITYQWDWNWSVNQDPSDGQWNLTGTAPDDALLKSTLSKMSRVPFVLTGLKVFYKKEPAGGLTYQGIGGVIDASAWSFFFKPTILAHELGHYAGYHGGDADGGIHSSRQENIMYKGGDRGTTPDSDYCTKVLLLAH